MTRGRHEVEARVAVCIGCCCTDEYACEQGCTWLRLDRALAVGVCSGCRDAVQAFDQGARGACATPRDIWDGTAEVYLAGEPLQAYRAGVGLASGVYYVLDDERFSLRLVDECGRPALLQPGAALQVGLDAPSRARQAARRRQ